MKKTLGMVITSSLLLSAMSGVARPQPNTAMIPLYNQPSIHSGIVNKISLNDNLVPIYKSVNRPDWVKVGDQHTGQVGWLNKDIYQQAIHQANQRTAQVTLYSHPSMHSKPITYVSANAPLIAITPSQDQQWIKVGNRQTGQVGWMNRQAYVQAQQQQTTQRSMPPRPPQVNHGSDYNQTNSVYISVTNKNGRQQITAYRNGQKLNDKQARHLWKKMQHKQHRITMEDEREQQQLQQAMNQTIQQFN